MKKKLSFGDKTLPKWFWCSIETVEDTAITENHQVLKMNLSLSNGCPGIGLYFVLH